MKSTTTPSNKTCTQIAGLYHIQIHFFFYHLFLYISDAAYTLISNERRKQMIVASDLPCIDYWAEKHHTLLQAIYAYCLWK